MTDSLGEIIADYRRSPLCDLGGEVMARFLESVADVLRSKVLYYSISHSRLGLSKFGASPERQEHPYVGVETDGRVFYLNYHEGWKDRQFYRSRTDNISCSIETRGRPSWNCSPDSSRQRPNPPLHLTRPASRLLETHSSPMRAGQVSLMFGHRRRNGDARAAPCTGSDADLIRVT